MHPRPTLLLTGFLATLGFLSLAGASAEDEFVDLLKPGDLSNFELVEIGRDTVSLKDGEIYVSGKPNGYFATKKSYKNYILKFDWKYDRPESLKSDSDFDGNSGLLIHIEGPHKVWPRCIEVQLANSDAGNIFKVGDATVEGTKDPAAQRKAIKPVGEWNSEEVTCRDGEIQCSINQVEVAKAKAANPDHGTIGWQSEGKPIRFKNLKIKVLD